jgi:chaperone required for assembly of F1-ATPase
VIAIRRFWTEAALIESSCAFSLHLDAKPAKTPAGHALATPHKRLAESVRDEWRHASQNVDPRALPMTGYLNAVIDRVGPNRAQIENGIVAFGQHDHLCYRAEGPADLVARQAAAWDPLLNWLADAHAIHLPISQGLTPIAVPHQTVQRMREVVSALDPYLLAGIATVAGAYKSLVLALSVQGNRLGAAEALSLSRLDEIYQEEHWGEDVEAQKSVSLLLKDVLAAERFLSLLDD